MSSSDLDKRIYLFLNVYEMNTGRDEINEYVRERLSPTIFHIFIDGSFMKQNDTTKDGWAFAIILQSGDCFTFIGFTTGHVVVDPSNRFFIGLADVNQSLGNNESVGWREILKNPTCAGEIRE